MSSFIYLLRMLRLKFKVYLMNTVMVNSLDGVYYSGLEIRCLYFSSHFLAFLFTLVAISFTLIAVPFHSVSVQYPGAFFI